MHFVKTSVITLGILALGVGFSGCKGDEETKAKVAELEKKLADEQTKSASLEADLKKTNYEVSQIKDLVTKLGNVTVDLQNAEEERAKRVEAAKTRSSLAPKGKAAAKKTASRPPAKKKGH